MLPRGAPRIPEEKPKAAPVQLDSYSRHRAHRKLRLAFRGAAASRLSLDRRGRGAELKESATLSPDRSPAVCTRMSGKRNLVPGMTAISLRQRTRSRNLIRQPMGRGIPILFLTLYRAESGGAFGRRRTPCSPWVGRSSFRPTARIRRPNRTSYSGTTISIRPHRKAMPFFGARWQNPVWSPVDTHELWVYFGWVGNPEDWQNCPVLPHFVATLSGRRCSYAVVSILTRRTNVGSWVWSAMW